MILSAIIGLDTYFGACRDGREFARAVVHGLRCAPAPDALRGMELALRVADNALFDANVARGARVAVLWAGEPAAPADIAALWGFGGPAAAAADGVTALAEAQHLLAAGAVDMALIGETGAAGGVALVLARADEATGRVYALIESGAGFPACGPAPQPGYWEWPGLAEGTLPPAAPAPEPTCALGSVHTNLGDAAPALAALARTALCLYHRVIPAAPDWRGPREPQSDSPFYVAPAPQPWLTQSARVASGELRVRSGESGVRSGEWRMANGELGVRSDELGVANHESSSPPDPSPITHYPLPITHYPIQLSASPTAPTAPVLHAHLSARPFWMFPLAGDDQAELLARAADLRQRAMQNTAPESLADDALAAYQARADAPYALALLAHDRDELLRELDHAVKGVTQAFATGKDWTSPLGSSFTARPLGPTGDIAFVYPGAFSSYVGMGRDLFQLFPHLHARLAAVSRNPGRAAAETLLYPRRLTPPTEADAPADDARLRANPTATIESGAVFAILYTSVLRDVFGVQPAAALGYSLGEASMLWALGVWPDGDACSEAWNTTPLFKTRLAGPQEAVREHWGLGAEAEGPVWGNYIVKAPAARVQQAVAAEPRVYLTMINEEKETVIAGHPEACARVIAALDCHALRMPFDAAIHSPALSSEYAAFVELYTQPTRAVPGINFFSAAEYAPLPLERDALARALAKMTCAPVDFSRLVRAAYDAGARLFIELGPLGACSRWIDRILRDRPHAAIPINRSGKSDYDSLLPVLALLTTQRISERADQRSGETADQRSGETADQRSGETADQRSGETANQQISNQQISNQQISNQQISNQQISNQQIIHPYTAAGHLAFLQARQESLRQTARLMAMQIDAAEWEIGGSADRRIGEAAEQRIGEAAEQRIGEAADQRISASPPPPCPPAPPLPLSPSPPPPLFTADHLRAFATGEVAAAFGPAYAHYRGRRVPRLPNGDLLCVSRVLAIDAPPGRVTPGAALVSEFDVPGDAWFFRDHAALPLSILMETALQPCGVLSTYLGSMLPYPESDFYFRNLDGEGELLRAVDARGRTIANRVTLLSSTALPGIILQKFSFEMACAGEVFYRGAAAFGYFTPEALQRQAGLDSGAIRRPWRESADFNGSKAVPSADIKRMGQLDFLDKAWCVPDGGEYGRGYVYAEIPVTPADWFFGCHFYQDPVMPGSLGVEAMAQAMQVYARAQGSGPLAPAPGRMTWKYRGQVPPNTPRLRLEVHLKDRTHTPEGLTLTGDASLWRENLRIYEVRDIKIGDRR